MEIPVELLQKWDELRRAIGSLQTAQLDQVSAAVVRLEQAKNEFEAVLNEVALNR